MSLETTHESAITATPKEERAVERLIEYGTGLAIALAYAKFRNMSCEKSSLGFHQRKQERIERRLDAALCGDTGLAMTFVMQQYPLFLRLVKGRRYPKLGEEE